MKIFRGSNIFMFSFSYIIFFLGIILPCSEEINIWLAYLPILPNPFLQLWKKYLPNFCYVSPLFAFLPLSCSESVKYFYAEASAINSFFFSLQNLRWFWFRMSFCFFSVFVRNVSEWARCDFHRIIYFSEQSLLSGEAGGAIPESLSETRYFCFKQDAIVSAMAIWALRNFDQGYWFL